MLGSLIAILFGSIFTILGLLGIYSRWKFFKQAIMVPGIIAGCKSYQERDSHGTETTMYQAVAVIELDGEKREVVSDWASSIKPKIGKPCQVGLNPSNIDNARIYSTGEGIFFWVLAGVGLLTVALGIWILTGKL